MLKVKQSIINFKKVSNLSILFILILLTSCSNFLKGSNAIKEITETVEYANAKKLTVRIDASLESGDIIPKGDLNLKKSDSREIQFTPSTSYQFIDFIAVDKNTGENLSEYVTFSNFSENKNDNKSIYKVTAKIVKEYENILIKPICIATPQIVTKTPSYDENGKPKNSPITIQFKTPEGCSINENSFRYTAEEIETLKSEENITDENLLLDANQKAYGYIKEGITYLKGITITSDGISFAEYYSVPILSDNKLTIAQNLDKPITVKESGFLDLYAFVSPNVYFDYQYDNNGEKNTIKVCLGENNNEWHYKLSNKTLERTKVTISADSKTGTLIKGQSGEYNLGETFEVEFKPNDEYEFKEWNYDKSYLEYIIPEKNEKKDTVTAKFKTISPTVDFQEASITVVSSTRAKALSKFPEDISEAHPCDSEISVIFDKPIDSKNFTFSNEELDELNIDKENFVYDEKGNIVAYFYNGDKVFKNITIKSGNTNFEKYFQYPIVSEDGKTVTIEANDEIKNLDFSSSSTKQITVTFSNSIVDKEGASIGKNIIWNYVINKYSTKSVTLKINYPENLASSNYANGSSVKCNVGDVITLEYAPKKNYSFSGWTFNSPDWKIEDAALEKLAKSNNNCYGYYTYNNEIVEVINTIYYPGFYDNDGNYHNIDDEATGEYVKFIRVSETEFDVESQKYKTKIEILKEVESEIIANVTSYLIPVIEDVSYNVNESGKIKRYSAMTIKFNKPMSEEIVNKLVLAGSETDVNTNYAGNNYILKSFSNFDINALNPSYYLSYDKRVLTVYFDFDNFCNRYTSFYNQGYFGPFFLTFNFENFEDLDSGLKISELYNQKYIDSCEVSTNTNNINTNTLLNDNKTLFIGQFIYDLNKSDDDTPEILKLDLYSTFHYRNSFVSLEKYEDWSNEIADTNHCNNFVKISNCKTKDMTSGIKGLKITEVLYKNADGTDPINPITYEDVYGVFTKDNIDYTSFSCPDFNYNFKTNKDGIIKLIIQACDAVGNLSDESKTYYLVKDTTFDAKGSNIKFKISNSGGVNQNLIFDISGSETYAVSNSNSKYTTDDFTSSILSKTPMTLYLEYGKDKNHLQKTKEYKYVQNSDYKWYCEFNRLKIPITNEDLFQNYYVKAVIKDAVGNEDYIEVELPDYKNLKLVNYFERDGRNYYYFNISDIISEQNTNSSSYYFDYKFNGVWYDGNGNEYPLENKSNSPSLSFLQSDLNGKNYRIYCNAILYDSPSVNNNKLFSYPKILLYDSALDTENINEPDFDVIFINKGNINSGKINVKVNITENFNSTYDYYFSENNTNFIKLNFNNSSANTEISYGKKEFTLVARKNNSQKSKTKIFNSLYNNTADTTPPVINQTSTSTDFKYSYDGKYILIKKEKISDSGIGLKTDTKENLTAECKYIYKEGISTSDGDSYIIKELKLAMSECEYKQITIKKVQLESNDYYAIPILDISKADGNLFLYLKVYDKNDNYCENLVASFVKVDMLPNIATISVDNSNKISLTFTEKNTEFENYSAICFKYDESKKDFTFVENKSLENDSVTFDCTASANTFFKTIVKAEEVSRNNKNNNIIYYHYYYPSCPVYTYIGNNKCDIKNIYESKNAITVFADKPVLAYTISSTKNYGDNLNEWECYGFVSNYQQLAFTSTTTMLNYNLNSAEINSGDYYVTVFRFADGTVMTGEIKQKN